MVGLTQKQREDVNYAIHEYFVRNNYTKSIEAFTLESGLDAEGYLKSTTTPSSLLKDILDRKWTSIARLKKQVMELEENNKQLKEMNEQYQDDLKKIEQNGGIMGGIEALTSLKKNNMAELDKELEDNRKNAGDAIPREPEKFKLVGHRARITKIIFHPKYTQVATSSEDASIKLWDFETGECEQTLRDHTGMVNYLNFHPDGDQIASCSRDMTIKLWRLNKNQEFSCYKTLQGHDHEVSCVEYVRPTGTHVISCSRDNSIRIWEAHSGFLLQTLQQHNEWVRRITQSHEGKMFASASKDESVIIWNMERIMQNLSNSKSVDEQDYIISVIDEHEHVIDCIKFANDKANRTIQTADYNKLALPQEDPNPNQTVDSTGDTTRGDDQDLMEEQKRMDDSTMNTESQKLTIKERVAALKKRLKDKKEGRDVEEEQKNLDQSIQIDTTAQEREIAEGNLQSYIATGSRDKKIRLFETKTGRCVLTLAGHDNWVTDLIFHPNGKYLISCADDKSIRIWDLQIGRCYRKIYNAHDHFISCIDMKGKFVASGSVDTSAKIWSCR